MLFSYKTQILSPLHFVETESLTILLFIKLLSPRAYCLLQACHTFCDELISLL